jgi:hypothetical protein
MRRVVVLAEAAEDLEAARAFYNAQEARVGEHCVNSLLTDIEAWRSAMESIASSIDEGFARLTGKGTCSHVVNDMSVTIELDLPEALVKEAKASGLLESRRLGEMLNEELRRERARKDLGRVLKELHSIPGEPMSPEEIQSEIDAVRAQRRQRESGH